MFKRNKAYQNSECSDYLKKRKYMYILFTYMQQILYVHTS